MKQQELREKLAKYKKEKQVLKERKSNNYKGNETFLNPCKQKEYPKNEFKCERSSLNVKGNQGVVGKVDTIDNTIKSTVESKRVQGVVGKVDTIDNTIKSTVESKRVQGVVGKVDTIDNTIKSTVESKRVQGVVGKVDTIDNTIKSTVEETNQYSRCLNLETKQSKYCNSSITLIINNRREKVCFTPINLLSLSSAINCKSNKELSRIIFKLLLHQPPNSLEYHQNKYKLSPNYKKQFHFYYSWLKCEQEWQDYIGLSDVYFEAIENLDNSQDLNKLNELYKNTLNSFKFYTMMNNDDDDEIYKDLIKRVERITTRELELDLGSKTMDPEPLLNDSIKNDFVPKTIDLLDDLGSKTIDLLDDFVPKTIDPESLLNDSIMNDFVPKTIKNSTKKVDGVFVNSLERGSNIILTPVKAKGKLKGINSVKIDLGVDKVITPVRRSSRFLNQIEYTNKGETTKEKIVSLLKDYDFAYTPNQVLIEFTKTVKFKLPKLIEKKNSDSNIFDQDSL
jgi:hypothetical protein